MYQGPNPFVDRIVCGLIIGGCNVLLFFMTMKGMAVLVGAIAACAWWFG